MMMVATSGGRKEPSNRIRKRLSVLTLSVVCLFAQGVATAQSAVVLPGDRVFNWTEPTQCEDGSDLGSSVDCPALIEYRLFCSSITTPYIIPAPESTFTGPEADFSVGQYDCYMLSFNGELSASSNITSFEVKLPQKPNPPSGLSVVVDSTAYNIIEQENSLVMLPVGTVKVGTTCDPNVTAMGRYAVPRDQVTWYGNVEPLVVFADCG